MAMPVYRDLMAPNKGTAMKFDCNVGRNTRINIYSRKVHSLKFSSVTVVVGLLGNSYAFCNS